jgi:hypothetical protein
MESGVSRGWRLKALAVSVDLLLYVWIFGVPLGLLGKIGAFPYCIGAVVFILVKGLVKALPFKRADA